MISVGILGFWGKMGAFVREAVGLESDMRVAFGVDITGGNCGDIPVYKSFGDVKESCDVIIDFSSPAALKDEIFWAEEHKAALVLASTGYSSEDIAMIERASKSVAVFRTANFSVGVNLLVKLVREAAAALGENFDIEIVERHHKLKADAPSGTALMLADSAKEAFEGGKQYVYGRQGQVGKRGKEIGIHAVRGGNIVGEHEVMFAGEDEIITLTHSARSKKVFAAGAVRAAKWIAGKPAGNYRMDDVLKDT